MSYLGQDEGMISFLYLFYFRVRFSHACPWISFSSFSPPLCLPALLNKLHAPLNDLYKHFSFLSISFAIFYSPRFSFFHLSIDATYIHIILFNEHLSCTHQILYFFIHPFICFFIPLSVVNLTLKFIHSFYLFIHFFFHFFQSFLSLARLFFIPFLIHVFFCPSNHSSIHLWNHYFCWIWNGDTLV